MAPAKTAASSPMSSLVRALILSICVLTLPAQGAGPLIVRDAWARATPPGARTGAAYLTIESRGDADRLLGATSPAARTLELHTHVTEGGVQRMVRLAEVEVPAGATVAFVPGGLHVMLIDLAAPLAPGATVALRLEFANAGPIEIAVPVIDARTAPAPGHAAH
jgi:copper(I)-binding protein